MRGWPSCNSPLTRRSEAFLSSGAGQLGPNRVPRETCRGTLQAEEKRVKPVTAHHIALAIAAIVLCGAQIVPASAQDPSTNQIINSLQPKVKFRSFDPTQAAKNAKQADLVNRLQNAKTRQITVEERSEIAEAVKENNLPAI